MNRDPAAGPAGAEAANVPPRAATRPEMPLSLVRAMLDAQRERRSGIFDVDLAGQRTRIYFATGRVVFAEGGASSDTLGRVLVRDGKLTTEQYTTALQRMSQQVTQSEPMRFGEAVLQLGFLRPEQVHEALAAQVRHKVVSCLTADEPEWTFHEVSTRVLGSVAHFPSTVEPLTLAAAKLFEGERVERVLELERGPGVRLLSDAESLGAAFTLSGAEQRVLQRIDGTRSVSQIVAGQGPGSNTAGPLLAALVLGGFAELCDWTPRPAETADGSTSPKGSHVGPLAPGAPIARVRLKSAPRPVAQPSPAGSGTVVATAARSNARAARLQAEEAFQKGKAHLDKGVPGLALEGLRRAAELCPDSVEFVLYMKWAELQAAEEESRPALSDGLRSIAMQAVKQSPNLAFGFFVLGWAAFFDDKGQHAARFFRQAVNLDPKMIDAERYLRLLQLRGGRASSPTMAAVKASGPKGPSTLTAVANRLQEALAALQPRPNASRSAPDLARPESGIRDARDISVSPAEAPSAAVDVAVETHSEKLQGPQPAPRREQPAKSKAPPRLVWAASVALITASVACAALFFARTRPHRVASRAQPSAQSLASPPRAPAVSAALPALSAALPATSMLTPPATPRPSTAPSLATRRVGPPAASNAAQVSDRTTGMLLTPRSASGHRIFVDGRLVGEAPHPVHVPCGRRSIKVGAAARVQAVLVPCGGTVTLQM